jgi:transposase-like protein
VQLCIAHLVRAALKYVTDKNSDQVIVDLKKIYHAAKSSKLRRLWRVLLKPGLTNIRPSSSSGV